MTDTTMSFMTGAAFDLADPRPEQVCLASIAEALAKIPRYAGQTPNVHYSVAQHCNVVVTMLPHGTAPLTRVAARLHDAPEFVLGDSITPLLNAMTARWPQARAAYDELHDTLDATIHAACGMSWPLPLHVRELVKACDMAARHAEWRDLMPAVCDPTVLTPAKAVIMSANCPPPRTINRLGAKPWVRAADEWLDGLRADAIMAGLSGPALDALA